MLEKVVKKILGIEQVSEEVVEKVNRLITITQLDRIHFDCLDRIVKDLEHETKLKGKVLFDKFVQYPAYEVWAQYELIKHEECGIGSFIIKLDDGSYTNDGYLSEGECLDDYLAQTFKYIGYVPVKDLVKVLTRINLERQYLSLVDLGKVLVKEKVSTYSSVLSLLVDIEEDWLQYGRSLNDYSIIKDNEIYQIRVEER